jgi:hypothetical protein
MASLSPQDAYLIEIYAHDSEPFNAAIRDRGHWAPTFQPPLPTRALRLQKLVMDAPRTPEAMLVFRGLTLPAPRDPDMLRDAPHRNLARLENALAVDQFVAGFKIGHYYAPAGFQAFSTNSSVAAGDFGGDILFVGILVKGSPAFGVEHTVGGGYSSYSEREIVLPHGTVFQYLGEITDSTLVFLNHTGVSTFTTRKAAGTGPFRSPRRILAIRIIVPTSQDVATLKFMGQTSQHTLNRPIRKHASADRIARAPHRLHPHKSH